MKRYSDPVSYFQLKSIRGARVSEISETTAAAPVPPEERVNFHIGNPIQDPRQMSAFLRIVLGLDIHQESLDIARKEEFFETLGWDESEKPIFDFFIDVLKNSSPYSPRGGYNRQNPNELVTTFYDWLNNQQEPLHYDLGQQSAHREIILASGGISEVMRVLLFVISSNLENCPARILNYRCNIPHAVRDIPNLDYEELDPDERSLCDQVEQLLDQQPDRPTYLLIGTSLEERTRRKLYLSGLNRLLFFIEANNVPNHLSLAREAELTQRVIRLLSPGIFDPRLQNLSTVFILGNANYLKVLENVHFQLKGTPSASEIQFLTYILKNKLDTLQTNLPKVVPVEKPSFYGLGMDNTAEKALPKLAGRVEKYLEKILDTQTGALTHSLAKFEEKAADFERQIEAHWKIKVVDEFASVDVLQLFDLLLENVDNPTWHEALERSFLTNFIKHQPQYVPESCLVVSGSSRTALGILGFHCGIDEVVIPDLSWSYEQCFRKNHVVPLTPSFELDVDAFINKLEELQQFDSNWRKSGAVVVSNPHNATGQIFREEAVRKLITYALQRNIYVVDDLAYQNVAPLDGLSQVKTARQIVEELVQQGVLDEAQSDRLISVHSLSKTDSFAGARLAVVEIRDPQVRRCFLEVASYIQPNLAAIFFAYLFYRNDRQVARSYWHLRNNLFSERLEALMTAVDNIPEDRNPFGLKIIPPKGSMYPLLQVEQLPDGLSLDWLASSLARQGIGMLPLATFARTEKGYETGRKTFRLTLGGTDGASSLRMKTRRLIIDLNRLIAEEEAHYNRKQLPNPTSAKTGDRFGELGQAWNVVSERIFQSCRQKKLAGFVGFSDSEIRQLNQDLVDEFLPVRLKVFRTRLLDRAQISDELMNRALTIRGGWLEERLNREFMKDSLARRQELFRLRSYDRTVHPTQVYSLQAEMAMDKIIQEIIHNRPVPAIQVEAAAHALVKEFLGQNVRISSQDETDEIMLDLNALTAAEDYIELFSSTSLPAILSFWSDWDGSNRPSGQGHRLVGMVVMENVRRMARIINLLKQAAPAVPLDPGLMSQIGRLPEKNQRFSQILNNITNLTHQLEQRYKGILPFSLNTTPLQRLATRLNLRRDPARVLWQHNDRYERKMLELRGQRRGMLEEYFALNKKIRKQLHALIPNILDSRSSMELLREVVDYRDLLQRTLITPRIHQRMVTDRDQFAADTTVFNLDEINTIAGKYGNPGMILALQVSMSTTPDALISLDRKFHTQEKQVNRENPQIDLPSVWIIPLFEDVDAVQDIRSYLDRVWDHAAQTRHSTQSPQERFAEIMSEVFIAGSDLSQQVSQAASANLYRKAKYDVQSWLGEHGVSRDVRVKLGSGEPMQRQGGYYSEGAGRPAFVINDDSQRRFQRNLPAAARQSTRYAVTPLQGIFLGGDLRTFQGYLSEFLRYLPVNQFANLLHHVRILQMNHRTDLIRASTTITESRLGPQSRSLQELVRLTIGSSDELYDRFLDELTDNFRHILYGREEDVIGMHAISYFIGRSLPQLRDRPTARKTTGRGRHRGQEILANIAEIIPFSEQGSLLRAIAHNKAQTVVLGINQLTTGLFRALELFSQKTFAEAERERMISDRLLPHLPVYEILSTLRKYQDWQGVVLGQIETAFPPGNSAFAALREDLDAMYRFIPLFQRELLRRHGLTVNDFFAESGFIPDMLPALRPELAVLLQSNLFNTDLDVMLAGVNGKIDPGWQSHVGSLLRLPEQIAYYRFKIWGAFGDTIYQRVQSFSELALALYSLSSTQSHVIAGPPVRSAQLSRSLTNFFQSAHAEDEMRLFLLSTMEYLNSFVEGNVEVPISIIRAINDAERIAKIEESALPPDRQDVIRFCTLQIARLAGENG